MIYSRSNANNARHMPPLHIDTEEILIHVARARATACRECEANAATLARDIGQLLAEITWLCQSLMRSRLRAANLEAAIRAALGADHDGEDDPLAYLRDEIFPDAGGAHGA
jgi:hypothetical protein